jgi:hypothetical protein
VKAFRTDGKPQHEGNRCDPNHLVHSARAQECPWLGGQLKTQQVKSGIVSIRSYRPLLRLEGAQPLPGRSEPFDSDSIRGDTATDGKIGCGVGEGGRSADEGGRVVGNNR